MFFDEFEQFDRAARKMMGEAIPIPEDPVELDGPDPIVIYRAGMLRKAGYSEENAYLLAEEALVDLHQAIELLKQGCDPTLALRILL